MTDTPYDVWSLIASFLPNDDVEKLCGVNKQLRELGLDARFREVKLNKHDSRMKRLCEMLSRDDVATHVRKLTIQPWLVQPRTKTYVSRSENLWNRVNTLFNPSYMEQEAEKRVQQRIDKDIKRVANAVQRLRSVGEYQIVYDERSTKYHNQLFEAFLSPTLEAFAPSLKRLTIKVPFDLLQHLSYVRLPQLQEFDITLCSGAAPMEEVNYALDGFFVFVHNLRHLEHLGISATSCSRNLDLSFFSERWGMFPRLKSFSLCIPFNGGLLSSPESIYKNVIEPHAESLENLKLRASSGALAPHGSLPRNCQFWIPRILTSSFNTPFLRLRVVELALRPLKAELADLHAFLRLHSATLENLCLTDRALNFNEVADVLESLRSTPGPQDHPLETLGIKVDSLSASLLVLIAQGLPNLKTLNLAFTYIMIEKGAELNRNASRSKLTSFSNILCSYSTIVFSDWNLRALHLVESPPNAPWIIDVARLLRLHFPPTIKVGKLDTLTA